MNSQSCFQTNDAAQGERDAAARDGCARSGGAVAGASTPRVVTTGGTNLAKAPEAGNVLHGVDTETGEPVELWLKAHGVQVVRRLQPLAGAPDDVAHVDALAFTVIPPSDYRPWAWLVDELRGVMDITDLEGGKGCFGYRESLRFGQGAGLVAWGGHSQRGTVYFSIQGKGCSLMTEREQWVKLVAWMIDKKAKIKRVDLAHDDLTGEVINMTWALHEYQSGGFNCGGPRPGHRLEGDWLAGEASKKGRTLYVGNRDNGKLCRIYEKGKQQGQPENRWTRIEVEWRSQDRVIPLDILLNPGPYLAGAYPCLKMLHAQQSKVRTIREGAQTSFEAAVEHLRMHGGKIINTMLKAFDGNHERVVQRLVRNGTPQRLQAYERHLAQDPSLVVRSVNELDDRNPTN